MIITNTIQSEKSSKIEGRIEIFFDDPKVERYILGSPQDLLNIFTQQSKKAIDLDPTSMILELRTL